MFWLNGKFYVFLRHSWFLSRLFLYKGGNLSFSFFVFNLFLAVHSVDISPQYGSFYSLCLAHKHITCYKVLYVWAGFCLANLQVRFRSFCHITALFLTLLWISPYRLQQCFYSVLCEWNVCSLLKPLLAYKDTHYKEPNVLTSSF